MEMDFEPNSHKYRMDKIANNAMDQSEDVRKVEKVISGETKVRKRSLVKRFADIFLSEDVGDVKQYLIYDILIPSIKENIYEAINGAVSMLFFGEATRRSKRPASPGSKGTIINYNAISTPTTRERLPSFSHSRIAHNFDDIIFETRNEAELVLDGMVEILNSEYGQVTVADFYDLAGRSTTFTDNKFGWTDLRSARVAGSASRGYYIDLPRCITLNS